VVYSKFEELEGSMRKTYLFLLSFISIVLLFSCASAPTTEVDLATAQGRASSAMEKAKSVKADVAVKTEFGRGQTAYTEADGLTGDAAIPKYLEAEGLLLAAHDAAVAKRDEAQKQLQKAKSDIKALEDQEANLKQEQEGSQ
jgi:hypothetical protein